MYSYEDRIRAVELYIRLGKRLKATIRQLGYPTKNALKSWHREYEQRSDLRVGYAGRPPKSLFAIFSLPSIIRQRRHAYDLLSKRAKKARWISCRLVLSFLSQFFHSLRHFSSQAKPRSTTQRCGITLKVCRSWRLAICTVTC